MSDNKTSPLGASIERITTGSLDWQEQHRPHDPDCNELKIIADNLPVLIAAFDRQERFRFSNRVHQEWWALSEHEIVGHTLHEVVGDINYHLIKQHARKALLGERVRFEHWCEYPGAGRRYVTVEYVPHFDDSGRSIGAFVLVHDNTAAKLAQEELDRQRHEQEIIFDTVPAMIWYKDSDNRILRLNRPAAKSAGKPEEMLRGVSTYDLYPEEASQYHQDDLEVIRSGRPKVGIVEPFTPHTGEKRWLRTDKFPYFDKAVNRSGVVVFSIDITEQKRAEDALRESEARMKRLLESTKVIPWQAEAGSARLSYVGPQALKTFGFKLENWYQDDFWSERIHPEDRAMTLAIMADRNEDASDYELEYRMMAQDGAILWVRNIVTVIRNDLGEAVMLQGFLLDITAHKKAEAEMLELQEQLRQAQKMEALGTLAGGIAHDFNNILGGIIGYTELSLAETPLSSSVQGHLRQVANFSHRAKDLVQQILSFSRRQHSDRSSCGIRAIIDEVLGLARATLPSSIRIVINEVSPHLHVFANATQLHQVFLNIVTNAGYAMRNRGGVLTVSIETRIPCERLRKEHLELRACPHVVVSIRDTGEGISPDIMQRIFEPYFTTKPFGEGSGLGLSVVHGIVTSYGGAITVSSSLGHGSLFEVYLPATSPEKQSVAVADHIETPRRGRILFVDDEQMLASLGQEILQRMGFEVIACTSSAEALELLRRKGDNIDLLITDQTMPDIRGEDLAHEVYALQPALPVILCSGLLTEVEHLRGKGNIVELLAKPYGLRHLSEAVSRAFSTNASRQTMRPQQI